MGGIVDIFTGGGGDDAAKASREASQLQAEYQQQALDYLKQQERLPTAYREQALQQLGSLYGLPGAPQQAAPQQVAPQSLQGMAPFFQKLFPGGLPSQGISPQVGQPLPSGAALPAEGYSPLGRGEFIAGLREDPFYQELLGAGEEAVLRGAAATGGLRSGAASEALARSNQSILRGLYGERVAGLQGMAGLGSMAPQVAQTTAGIGQTLAQGQIGAAQAQQAGQQQAFGNIMGLGQLGLGIAGMFSDSRLKDNLKLIGKYHGHNLYSWDWNEIAATFGLEGPDIGVLADEVKLKNPELISEQHGYLTVDYSKLGVN